jgi:hypothetical protein
VQPLALYVLVQQPVQQPAQQQGALVGLQEEQWKAEEFAVLSC